MLIRLAHLQTMFFLERLLLLNGSLDEGNMLLLCFEMLTLTLSIWTHKDRFVAMRRNFEWLVSNATCFFFLFFFSFFAFSNLRAIY
jgi:hypothetical protein